MDINTKEVFLNRYESPIGELLLTAERDALTGIWFDGSKYFEILLQKGYTEAETDVIIKTRKWLDIYFSGRKPDFAIPIRLAGTDFQKEVWELLTKIPYGKTTTYGELAGIIARERGISRMSAQAVGGAVGRNPIPIIVPCHRVIGANGSLVGFSGGMDKKIALLGIEKIQNMQTLKE